MLVLVLAVEEAVVIQVAEEAVVIQAVVEVTRVVIRVFIQLAVEAVAGSRVVINKMNKGNPIVLYQRKPIATLVTEYIIYDDLMKMSLLAKTYPASLPDLGLSNKG